MPVSVSAFLLVNLELSERRLASICLSRADLTRRQWPKVHDLCHAFLHVARVKNLRPCENRVNVQKRATKSDASGHCLVVSTHPAIF